MLCQRCHTGDAITRDGQTVTCHLFGEITGAFCADCLVELQRPYDAALRERISDRLPALSDADLARFPDQMLKFTLCLPIPPGSVAGSAPRSAPPSPGCR